MNRKAFKSAYDKIALSEEFKRRARAELISKCSEQQNAVPLDYDDDSGKPKIIRIEQQKKSRTWIKAAAGVGAAAVVGVSVWGVFKLSSGNEISPNSGDTSEAGYTSEIVQPESAEEIPAETYENPVTAENELIATSEAETFEISTVTETLVKNTIVLPDVSKYYDGYFGAKVLPCQPFAVDISLPEGWSLRVTEQPLVNAMLLFDENNSEIGTLSFSAYSIVDDMTHEDENYHRMVYGDIMNSAMVNWADGFEVVNHNGDTCAAVSNIQYHNDSAYSGYGVLAHNDKLRVQINMGIENGCQRGLVEEIAKTVSITESREATADYIKQDLWGSLTLNGERDSYPLYVSGIKDGDTEFVIADISTESLGSGRIYAISGGQLKFVRQQNFDEIKLYKKGDEYLISNTSYTKDKALGRVYSYTMFLSYYGEGYAFERTARLYKITENGSYAEGRVIQLNGESTAPQALDEEQYSTEINRLLEGCELIGELKVENHTAVSSAEDIGEKVRIAMGFEPSTDTGWQFYYDRNAAEKPIEMESHTVSMALCVNDGHGHFSGHESGKRLDITFNLPKSWELVSTVASAEGTKAFELFVPFPTITNGNYDVIFDDEYEMISYENHRHYGTDADLYKFYVYRSVGDKYSVDGSYDVHQFVVTRGEYDIMLSFVDNGNTDYSLYREILSSVQITE